MFVAMLSPVVAELVATTTVKTVVMSTPNPGLVSKSSVLCKLTSRVGQDHD